MRRVVIRGVLILVVLAWLAGAGVMMFFDPQAPRRVPFDIAIEESVAGRVLGYDGYICASGVGFGPNGDDPAIDTVFVRQPLDRSAGSFPLSLRYVTNNKTPLQRVRLGVSTSSRADLDDADEWTWIGAAEAEQHGAYWVATIENAPAPAAANTGMLCAEETLADGSQWSFCKSMPQAPTFLGRVHDTIGHWPLFSWIPQLR